MLRTTLLLTLIITLWPSAADADEAFRQALRAQNAHHLRANPTVSAERGAKQEALVFIERVSGTGITLANDGGSKTFRDGDISVTVTRSVSRHPASAKGRVHENLSTKLTLSVFVAGQKALSFEYGEMVSDFPSYRLKFAEMDPGNVHKEILFMSWTGGAHCCWDTKILTSSQVGQRWNVVDVAAFDGDDVPVRDLDGDGRSEIAVTDKTFNYAFDSYAGSWPPRQVLRLDGGKIVDASREPRYRAFHVAGIRRMAELGFPRKGFLSGYVAQKTLLGEGGEAWDLMLSHRDQVPRWEDEKCLPEGQQDRNSQVEKVPCSFPKALRQFLELHGYAVPDPL